MALLRHAATGRAVELPATATVGRSRRCDVVIEDPAASSVHAVLRWDGERWTLRDLESRNGTWLGGRPVAPGVEAPLASQATLAFGAQRDPWILADDAAPWASATRLDSGERVLAAGGLLVLGEAAVLFRAGRWVFEQEGVETPVEDGEEVEAGGARWRLALPVALPRTADESALLHLEELEIRFRVSADEEHVEAALRSDRGEFGLGARAHHYLLLTLARARLRDREDGVADPEEGWEEAEILARRLGLTLNAFNVQCNRARAQLAEAGVVDAAGLFERRGGRIRLGLRAVDVRRG